VAFEVPKGLPKISQFTSVLANPESQFEKMVKDVVKVELPEGPQSMLTRFQQAFELGEVAPEIPELPKIEQILGRFPELPKLPELPMAGGLGEEPRPGYQPEKERTKRGYIPIG